MMKRSANNLEIEVVFFFFFFFSHNLPEVLQASPQALETVFCIYVTRCQHCSSNQPGFKSAFTFTEKICSVIISVILFNCYSGILKSVDEQ